MLLRFYWELSCVVFLCTKIGFNNSHSSKWADAPGCRMGSSSIYVLAEFRKLIGSTVLVRVSLSCLTSKKLFKVYWLVKFCYHVALVVLLWYCAQWDEFSPPTNAEIVYSSSLLLIVNCQFLPGILWQFYNGQSCYHVYITLVAVLKFPVKVCRVLGPSATLLGIVYVMKMSNCSAWCAEGKW